MWFHIHPRCRRLSIRFWFVTKIIFSWTVTESVCLWRSRMVQGFLLYHLADFTFYRKFVLIYNQVTVLNLSTLLLVKRMLGSGSFHHVLNHLPQSPIYLSFLSYLPFNLHSTFISLHISLFLSPSLIPSLSLFLPSFGILSTFLFCDDRHFVMSVNNTKFFLYKV